ncbi:MAG: hypothetical protein GX102_09890 [Porphyromonadaceae bacterium]|nr:hypothetical protein [Porphyromonadaceae bacterium]
MNPHLKKLFDYKQRAIQRTSNPIAIKAIQFELQMLEYISGDIIGLEEQNKILADKCRTLEEAKAIAEMVSIIHGLSPEVIRDYYQCGLEYTLQQVEFLRQENQIVIPSGLKKHFK